jgi:predicted RNA-binding protein with RPS1 domain
MTFWQFLKRTDGGFEGLTEAFAEHFSELLARGHSIADLLSHYGEEFGHLPVDQLRSLSRTHRWWKIWRRREKQIADARARAKLPMLPAASTALTTTPDELDALARTARICDPAALDAPAAWEEVLQAGLQLWRSCLRLTRKEGLVHCEAVDAAHPEISRYDEFISTRQPLDDIASHRWLAMRRGSRQGVLRLTVEAPQGDLLEQAELYRPRLAVASAAERTAASLLDELVVDDLEPWLLSILDTEAEAKAIEAACQSLTGLLKSAPLQSRRAGALFLGRNRAVAAVVVDREGDIVAQRVLKPEGEWIARVRELLEEHKIHHLVLPTTISPGDHLSTAAEELAQEGLQIQRVRTAALAEARLPLTHPPERLSPSVAAALVLARRAIDPIKAWSAVDPVSIGIAEYQGDLDAERLRAALKETFELCRLERRRGRSASQAAVPAPRAGVAMARLNPLIRSAKDLRPGMTVHGVVTNVSHFGAFVSIGLPQEALIHISELSDEYVSNPNEVVTIGQQITARILSADPTRGRISLSMKSSKPAPGGTRERPRAAGRRSSASSDKSRAPRSRNEALASLERLFKK